MSIEEPAAVGLDDDAINEWFDNLGKEQCCCTKGSACEATHEEPLCKQCETYCIHLPVPGQKW